MNDTSVTENIRATNIHNILLDMSQHSNKQTALFLLVFNRQISQLNQLKTHTSCLNSITSETFATSAKLTTKINQNKLTNRIRQQTYSKRRNNSFAVSNMLIGSRIHANFSTSLKNYNSSTTTGSLKLVYSRCYIIFFQI